MKNRLQFNRHFALYETREEALNALNTRITDPGFIPLIGEPIVLRYKDANDNVQAILAIGKKAGKSMSDRDYHIVDTADLDEKIAAEVAAREALDAETIKKVIFDGVESQFADNVATLSVSANSIPIGPYEEYVGPVDGPHEIHDYYTVLDAVKQIDVNFEDLADKTNKKLEGLHLVKVTSGLDVNVREAYDLVNVSGIPQENSSRILIYKDSSLYRAYLGHVDDSLTSMSDPTVISGTGDTAICFIYLRVDGFYDLVAVNVEKFIEENEFKDGLVVNNHEVKVKIDANSEGFLTVSADGVKLAGIQNAIDTAKSEEEARAEDAEEAIQAELDNTQVGAGLDSDGSYIHYLSTAYILTATSLANADYILDTELKAVSDYAEASSGALATRINLEEARAQDAEGILSQLVSDEAARALAAEAFISAITTNITSGAGLASDGSYIHDHPTAYIGDAKSLANADHILDVNLKAVSDYAEASSGALTTRIDHLDELVAEEVARAIASETFISAITTNIISGAGLSLGEEEGLYPKNHHAGAVIISSAQSLDQADMLLDAAVGGLSGELLTLSSVTEAFSGTVENELNYLSGETTSLSAATVNIGENLTNLSGGVISLSATVESFSANVETLIKELSSSTSDDISALSASVVTLSAKTNEIESEVSEAINDVNTRLNNVSGDVINLSAITAELAEEVTGLSKYEFFGDEDGVIKVTAEPVIDPTTREEYTKVTTKPAMASNNIPDWDYINNSAITGSNGLVTAYQVKQYVKDGLDGDATWVGDKTLPIPEPGQENPLVGRINFDKESQFYDTVHEAFYKVDNDLARLADTIGLEDAGYNAFFYPSARTEGCLIISTGSGVTDIMSALTSIDKFIDNMDWSGKTNENQVFTYLEQENGTISAGCGNIANVKLADYQEVPVTNPSDEATKVKATDTLGQGLGKLQGQINAMDWSGETTINEVFVKIEEKDGLISATTANITGRKLAGYELGGNNKVAADQSLGQALGNLQGQINALNYTGITGDDYVFTGLTETSGLVSTTSALTTSRKLSGYSVVDVVNPYDEETKVNSANTLGVALGRLQGQINAMDKTATTETGKFVRTVIETDGKVAETKGFIVEDDVKISAATAAEVAALGTNVKEAYKLINQEGTRLGDWVKIYKDSALQNFYLGHVDDYLTHENQSTHESPDTNITNGTGDTALVYVMQLGNGNYKMASVNVESFLQEVEFGSGVTADSITHKVSGVVDTNSEKVYTGYDAAGNPTAQTAVLSVGANGFKVSNIQTAIDKKIETLDSTATTTNAGYYLTNITIHDGKIVSKSEQQLSANETKLSRVPDTTTGNVLTDLSVDDHEITLTSKNVPESAFTTVNAGATAINATSTADTITFTGSTPIIVTGNNKTITVSHSGSPETTKDAGSGNYIQKVTLDSYGHVVGLTTGNCVNSATSLANKPVLAVGTTDTNKITVNAGEKTSDEFTVPYATNADTVDGLHFVIGRTGTAANTIYFL